MLMRLLFLTLYIRYLFDNYVLFLISISACFLACRSDTIILFKQVYPSSGPVNGGTLVTITGKYLGNTTDNISVNISGVICNDVTVTIPNTE